MATKKVAAKQKLLFNDPAEVWREFQSPNAFMIFPTEQGKGLFITSFQILLFFIKEK